MRLKRFKAENLEEVNMWHALRHMASLKSDMIPTIGYYVPGVAAGFLFRTDCSVCFLDGYISNPLTQKSERAEALDKITSALLDTAERLGYHVVVAMTQNPSVRKRCEENKFNYKGERSLFIRGA